VGLLDSTAEEPHPRLLRYAISVVVFLLLVALGFWYLFRFYPERQAVAHFLDAVVAGDMQRAYQLWHPQTPSSYALKDFMDDWGPNGYYGPIKSYQIESAENPRRGGSGVIVVIDVSPFQPFPGDNDAEKNRRTKVVRLWVERSDKSLSFPP